MPNKTQDFYNQQQENTPYQQDFYQMPPPSYTNEKSQNNFTPNVNPTVTATKNEEDELLNLPSIPSDNDHDTNNQNASIEFDDLAKRFENLKSFKK